MKLIINIPGYRFEQCQKDIPTLDLYEELADAVKNGTPLPKGYGRLIDADDVNNHICGYVDLRDCPTIIEAYRENKDESSD